MAGSLLFVAAILVLPSLTSRIVRFTPIVLPQEESPPDWTQAKKIFEREEAAAKKKWSWPNFLETTDAATMTAELTAMSYMGKFKTEPYGVFLDSKFTKKSVAKLVNYHPKATDKKFVIVQKKGNIPLFINYGKNKWHFMFVGPEEPIADCIGGKEIKIFVMRQTVIHEDTGLGTKIKSAFSFSKKKKKEKKKEKKNKAHLQKYNDYYYGDNGYKYDEYDGYDEYGEYDVYELYRLYRLLQGYNH